MNNTTTFHSQLYRTPSKQTHSSISSSNLNSTLFKQQQKSAKKVPNSNNLLPQLCQRINELFDANVDSTRLVTLESRNLNKLLDHMLRKCDTAGAASRVMNADLLSHTYDSWLRDRITLYWRLVRGLSENKRDGFLRLAECKYFVVIFWPHTLNSASVYRLLNLICDKRQEYVMLKFQLERFLTYNHVKQSQLNDERKLQTDMIEEAMAKGKENHELKRTMIIMKGKAAVKTKKIEPILVEIEEITAEHFKLVDELTADSAQSQENFIDISAHLF